MAESVADQIDRQVAFLHRCRAVFPRLDTALVGETKLEASEYFKQQGHSIEIQLSSPLTEDLLYELNELAHWLNENFVVRLYAVMESNQLVSEKIKIDQALEGWEELDILRRLRNKVGHGTRGYDINDQDHVKLYERIVVHFGIKKDYSYLEVDKYPIGIAKVLVPMANGCKRYAEEFAKRAATPLQRAGSADAS
jgi:hypothetical protein